MSQSLASERDRFVAFAFAAGDVLVETDDAGCVRYATGALGRFLPRGTAFEGQSFLACLGEADRPLIGLLMDEVAQGGRRGPVAMANADGTALAECSLLRAPQMSNCHFVLRQLADGSTAGAAKRGDAATGLLDARALGEHAERELLRLVETDQKLELSLIRLAGLERLPGGLDGPDGRGLVQRLAAALRAVSLSCGGAARLGDDRFALVHGGDGEGERLNRLLRARLDEAGLEDVRIERRDVDLRESTLSPNQACAALRHAIDSFARAGRADFDDLADALGQKVAATAARIADAKAVIESRGFYVFYQPIVGLRDGRVHHHEALSRLRDDAHGIFDFVTFAETVGFIADFDLAVAREVLDKLAHLRRRRRAPAVAVNLSACSLSSEPFLDRLLTLSDSAGPNAAQVLFEVTESFQLSDLEQANAAIQRLRKAGHEVCLDDFGAGAAAFHYIRALEVDYVKLDGAFVQRVSTSERDRTVLAGMVELCRSLGVATVAEMVETHTQADGLRRLGVDYAQGFFYGRPTPDPVERVSPD